jgi:carbonic anhydrase/acetyltransferase-like protein (isoleucine patch superfamily)
MILPYKNKQPVIAEDAFVAPNATIVGDVRIASGANIWYGTVIRGDLAPIRIGADTNIQDNCTIHTDMNQPAIIGRKVTVGHNAVVHGCVVEDRCLIGMNAVVLSGAQIKTGTIIAAGAVVKEGQTAGPFQLLAGTPAQEKKALTEEILEILDLPVHEYLELAQDHRAALRCASGALQNRLHSK